jgi:hypothetical protein
VALLLTHLLKRVNHYLNDTTTIYSKGNPAIFILAMSIIINRNVAGITKYRRCLTERDFVFLKVAPLFLRVPLKAILQLYFLNRVQYKDIISILYTNLMIMEDYLPGIQAILAGDASPLEAIRAIESTDTELQPVEYPVM